MTDHSNPWDRLSTQRLYDCRFYGADEDQLRHRSSGDVIRYSALRFHIVGIAVLPIDADGFTTLVGQFRYMHNRYTWEVVRGAGSLDTEPMETARRELKEETGLTANHWHAISNLTASPGVTDEMAPTFVAWELHQGQPNPDKHEGITRHRLPFSEAVDWVLEGKIVDAASAALLLAVDAAHRRDKLPAGLAALL